MKLEIIVGSRKRLWPKFELAYPMELNGLSEETWSKVFIKRMKGVTIGDSKKWDEVIVIPLQPMVLKIIPPYPVRDF